MYSQVFERQGKHRRTYVAPKYTPLTQKTYYIVAPNRYLNTRVRTGLGGGLSELQPNGPHKLDAPTISLFYCI